MLTIVYKKIINLLDLLNKQIVKRKEHCRMATVNAAQL